MKKLIFALVAIVCGVCSVNAGEAQSCATAGFVYLFGDGTQIDYKLAKSYFEKSCEMQNFYGCSMLSVMYRDGKSVEQNLSKAKEYHDKACNLGKIDCDE